LFFPAGTTSNQVLSLRLSQVCDVVTDPSTEAFLPTMIDVHESALAIQAVTMIRTAVTDVISLCAAISSSPLKA
jgi:hypothetical protein